MRASAALALASALALAGACVDRLPDQDRRILAASAITKVPAEDLWKEFQADRARAHDTYWGKAIEVSGPIVRTAYASCGASTNTAVSFAGHDGSAVVIAKLLDDQAAAILAEAKDATKLRLKCYCAGYDGKVQLTSCVKP